MKDDKGQRRTKGEQGQHARLVSGCAFCILTCHTKLTHRTKAAPKTMFAVFTPSFHNSVGPFGESSSLSLFLAMALLVVFRARHQNANMGRRGLGAMLVIDAARCPESKFIFDTCTPHQS